MWFHGDANPAPPSITKNNVVQQCIRCAVLLSAGDDNTEVSEENEKAATLILRNLFQFFYDRQYCFSTDISVEANALFLSGKTKDTVKPELGYGWFIFRLSFNEFIGLRKTLGDFCVKALDLKGLLEQFKVSLGGEKLQLNIQKTYVESLITLTRCGLQGKSSDKNDNDSEAAPLVAKNTEGNQPGSYGSTGDLKAKGEAPAEKPPATTVWPCGLFSCLPQSVASVASVAKAAVKAFC